MNRYNPKEIEPKWQQRWDESQVYKANLTSDKPKYLAMSMFNYPSGSGIHIGHAMNYTISDVMARFKRQQGYESYHPVGWDAFGLPAENFAIKSGISPQASMANIIPSYHMQYKAMGWSNDWSKEISTHQPAYYKWTQWIFAQMYKHGLVYQDSRMQWWCDKCQTVLANEQVIDGKCWRHDAADDPLVEKKEVKQWFFKITDYADELLEAIDDLDWTESVKLAQKNWIGKSKGAEVEFIVGESTEPKDSLKFTPELTHLVQIGSKWSTFRYEPKNLQVGDTAKLITRFSGTETRAFGLAEITKVETVKLKDIPLDQDGHESDESGEVRLARYRTYYGDDVTDDSEFTIYEFKKTADIITVFTTRPDTLYGATFMVLAPEHGLVAAITTNEQKQAVEEYARAAQQKSELERQTSKEKTGVFTGAYAVNPVNGEKLPIWIADYVLEGYGTGAIMAVPAHDERDNEFAKKFNLPIIRVVQNGASDDECSHEEGVMINSGAFDGQSSSDVRENIVKSLAEQGAAVEKVNYKLRDWSVSRQRYWGAPIPIVYCEKDGIVLVPDGQLPVVLPELTDFAPSGDGRSALARAEGWLDTTCPTCGGPARRETDTLDTYICSSWYFLRYLDPTNESEPFQSSIANAWMPVNFYNGGDHATAHMIYARFVTRFFHKLGLLENPEPFNKFLFNGKVTASDGTMFSKSKGNGIDPLEIIESGYGADALRTYLMFAAPLELWMRWDAQGVPGTHRFLSRIWNLVQEFLELGAKDSSEEQVAVLRVIHRAIHKVSSDIEGQKYNTAIAAMMEATNTLYELKAKEGFVNHANWQFALDGIVALVAPFAPHIADELWEQLGHTTSVQRDSWPVYDEAYLVDDTITIAVQINGKLRATIEVPASASEEEVVVASQTDTKVASYLANMNIVKTIYVPRKLVNFVVR
jgi:leucyl-tRNA synthetase